MHDGWKCFACFFLGFIICFKVLFHKSEVKEDKFLRIYSTKVKEFSEATPNICRIFQNNFVYQYTYPHTRKETTAETNFLKQLIPCSSVAGCKKQYCVWCEYFGIGNHISSVVRYKNRSLFKEEIYIPIQTPKRVIDSREITYENQAITIVVPCYDSLSKLETFIHFNKGVINSNDQIQLLIVTAVTNNFGQELEILALLKRHFDSTKFQLTSYKGDFSRGRSRNFGASKVSDDGLIFFSDIDMVFTNGMITRCIAHTQRSKSLYYPIVFSQYNPKLSGIDINVTNFLEISYDSGFWRDFGFGMVCIYRSDFASIGGFPEYNKWGDEDYEFYKRSKRKMKTIRVIDPDLVHKYHSKDCKGNARSEVMCLNSQSRTEGSNEQLGIEILKIKNLLGIS